MNFSTASNSKSAVQLCSEQRNDCFIWFCEVVLHQHQPFPYFVVKFGGQVWYSTSPEIQAPAVLGSLMSITDTDLWWNDIKRWSDCLGWNNTAVSCSISEAEVQLPSSDLFSRMNDVHGFTSEIDFLKNKYLLGSNRETPKVVNTLSKPVRHSEHPAS